MVDDRPTPLDPWEHLRRLTSARIALGRSGGSVLTRELLDFSLCHARARDAVHSAFDPQQLAAELQNLGIDTVDLQSAAVDRAQFLHRPDLGRRLEPDSRARLETLAGTLDDVDLVLIVSDGLSALAAHRQAPPLLEALLPLLHDTSWKMAPVLLVRHARVAIQDEIGAALGAQLAVILLGERPGLGTPDSLGAYLVYNPAPGRTDAQRNCISNIRPEGLSPTEAARTLHYLLSESRRRKLSGVQLKDQRRLLPPV